MEGRAVKLARGEGAEDVTEGSPSASQPWQPRSLDGFVDPLDVTGCADMRALTGRLDYLAQAAVGQVHYDGSPGTGEWVIVEDARPVHVSPFHYAATYALLDEKALQAAAAGPPPLAFSVPEVGPEWHDRFLIAAEGSGMAPCSFVETCEGMLIEGFYKILPGYHEPDTPPPEHPVPCLLCTRRAWYREACKTLAQQPAFFFDQLGGHPEERLPINTHSVRVGVVGEQANYAMASLVTTSSGSPAIRGFSGNVLQYARRAYFARSNGLSISQGAYLFQ